VPRPIADCLLYSSSRLLGSSKLAAKASTVDFGNVTCRATALRHPKFTD
jgi:hypothetical protein